MYMHTHTHISAKFFFFFFRPGKLWDGKPLRPTVSRLFFFLPLSKVFVHNIIQIETSIGRRTHLKKKKKTVYQIESHKRRSYFFFHSRRNEIKDE